MNEVEAKAWLIQQILSEADRTGTPLDSLEAGMLEYSETARTPPGLEALVAAFDQQHDSATYEAKIRTLISDMLTRWQAEANPKLGHWQEATEALRGHDHYLLTLISAANRRPSIRSKKDGTSWLTIFVIAVLATALITYLLDYLAAR